MKIWSQDDMQGAYDNYYSQSIETNIVDVPSYDQEDFYPIFFVTHY